MVIKVLRILKWQVIAKVALELPSFMTVLVATQTKRKIGKWMRRDKPAVAPAESDEGPAHEQ